MRKIKIFVFLLMLILILSGLVILKSVNAEAEEENNTPEINSDLVTSAGFIIPHDEPLGLIIGHAEKSNAGYRSIFSVEDKVFIDAGLKSKIHLGDKFNIYRAIKKVNHPQTGKEKGFLIEILGKGEIIAVGEVQSVLLIVQSYSGIEIGDKILNNRDVVLPDEIFKGDYQSSNVSGQILETKSHKEISGQNDIVYLDQGKNKGIYPGDNFIVYRYMAEEGQLSILNPLKKPAKKIKLGKLKILSVKGETSTALITRAKEEVLINEKVESNGEMNEK